jgi:hypothetical protein
MVRGKRTYTFEGNGGEDNEPFRCQGHAESSKSRKHRRKSKQKKNMPIEMRMNSPSRQTAPPHFRRGEDRISAEGERTQPRLGRSPLQERSRQSPVSGDRSQHGGKSSDNRRQLGFGDINTHTAADRGAPSTRNPLNVQETTAPPSTPIHDGVVPSPAGSPALHLDVHMHSSRVDSVGAMADGEGGHAGQGSNGVVITTPTESLAGPPRRTTSMGTSISDRGRRPSDTDLAYTVQPVTVVRGQRRPHAGAAISFNRATAGFGGDHENSQFSNGRGRREMDVSSGMVGEDTQEEQSSEGGAVDTSALQWLHRLMRALNPHERQVFLATHNLVNELRSTMPEEGAGREVTGLEEGNDVEAPAEVRFHKLETLSL